MRSVFCATASLTARAFVTLWLRASQLVRVIAINRLTVAREAVFQLGAEGHLSCLLERSNEQGLIRQFGDGRWHGWQIFRSISRHCKSAQPGWAMTAKRCSFDGSNHKLPTSETVIADDFKGGARSYR